MLKNKKCKLKKGFTLIELIVSITILSIIMISVITIFVSSSNLSLKIDINREMQSNIKNVIETIAEDIRKNGIFGVSSTLSDSDCSTIGLEKYKFGTKLCTPHNQYYLAKKVADSWLRVGDISNDCKDLNSYCTIVKKSLGEVFPLTNSFVSFRKLDFTISKNFLDKVTINFTMQPSAKKGIKSNLIKENKIIFQTTLSERLIKTK